jgi:hypothetical protein
MTTVALTGLLKIELPEDTIRFSDGGFISYLGETYRSSDATFGTIGGLQTMSEGVGDVVPAVVVTILPPTTEGAALLSAPGNQTARARFIVVEYNVETGNVISGNVEFDGQIDQSILQTGFDKKEVSLTVVSLAEKLFERNTGNTMNPSWHKYVHPGERGHDNATALGRTIAWGVEQPPSAFFNSGGSGGGSGGGGGGGLDFPNVVRF